MDYLQSSLCLRNTKIFIVFDNLLNFDKLLHFTPNRINLLLLLLLWRTIIWAKGTLFTQTWSVPRCAISEDTGRTGFWCATSVWKSGCRRGVLLWFQCWWGVVSLVQVFYVPQIFHEGRIVFNSAICCLLIEKDMHLSSKLSVPCELLIDLRCLVLQYFLQPLQIFCR